MKESYNWGILAPGKIAGKFASDLASVNGANLYAVGSRSADRAEEFAKKYGFQKSYGSYEELLSDPDLDIVYIASPHSHHYRHTMMALEAGRNVLCEKAFSHNRIEVEEMIEKASAGSLFLMEALWPPFQPSYRMARDVIESGELGEIVHLRSHFAFVAPYDPEGRLYNPELAGGALLDIGIYPVMDALSFMGVPKLISAVAGIAPTGVDHTIDIRFDYGNGRTASLYASIQSWGGTATEIFCTKGKILLERGTGKGQICQISREGKETVTERWDTATNGFEHEAAEVMKSIGERRCQSSVVPWSFSIDLITILDSVRGKIGLIYPGELKK
ncbi:MAG: Gfo/Idh/MocA family oxidoreductase [Bacteroidales bacterium]|nr:Gfo/Idh/MocA family oxidoreductase [Bacteroidales bacterium]